MGSKIGDLTTSTEQKGHGQTKSDGDANNCEPSPVLVTKTLKEFMHAVLAFNFAPQKTRKVQIHSQCDRLHPALEQSSFVQLAGHVCQK